MILYGPGRRSKYLPIMLHNGQVANIRTLSCQPTESETLITDFRLYGRVTLFALARERRTL